MSNANYDDLDPSLFILNEKNKWITKDFIENMLQKYGVNHTVKDLELYKRTMIHVSYLHRTPEEYAANRSKKKKKKEEPIEPISDPSLAIPLQTESYERLEFLGDSVIHLILAEYLFNRYNEREGFMTRLRTKIENSDTLANLNRNIGLNEYILISRHIEKNNGRVENNAALEDSFEAFIAAMYIDAGFQKTHDFLINLIEKELDFAQILHVENNFKDVLLQYFHKMSWADPTYGVLDISGPDHRKRFTCYIKWRKTPRDDGEIVGIGVGSSKKGGEQEAARQALIHFGEINEESDDEYSDSEVELA